MNPLKISWYHPGFHEPHFGNFSTELFGNPQVPNHNLENFKEESNLEKMKDILLNRF